MEQHAATVLHEESERALAAEGHINEIEAKVLNIHADQVEAKLKEGGATLIFYGEIQNIILDYAGDVLKKRGINARVRRVTEVSKNKTTGRIEAGEPYFIWTIKGSPQESENKKRTEIESPERFQSETDATSALSITLKRILGIDAPLVEVRRVTKVRKSYRYGDENPKPSLRGIQVDIDSITDVTVRKVRPRTTRFPLPTLMEIEPHDEENADAKIELSSEELGVKLDREQRGWSEGDVLSHYGIAPR